jgi:hypothetical protein
VCYFLTVGVPERCVTRLRESFASGFELRRIDARAPLPPFPPGDALHQVVSGMCSCDLYVTESKSERVGRRLRKRQHTRGWSDTKLRRLSNSLARTPEPFTGLRPDVRHILADLATRCGRVTLLVHDYAGAADTERVVVTDRRKVTGAELISDPASAPEDVLVEITGPARGVGSSFLPQSPRR